QAQVKRAFALGPSSFGSRGLLIDPVFELTFIPGLLNRSLPRVSPPRSLSFGRNEAAQFASPNGAHFEHSSLLSTLEPARGLSERIVDSNALSVVVWFKPMLLSQTGPARIVSLSGGPAASNFVLGQVGRELEFRLRTKATDRNGLPKRLRSEGIGLNGRLQNVTVTYAEGILRMHIDGVHAGKVVVATPTFGALSQAGWLGWLCITLFSGLPVVIFVLWWRHRLPG
ncbi:MAG: LamG-like jellyroll fold domain-containing protein, partial [Pseudomonadota bacterium]